MPQVAPVTDERQHRNILESASVCLGPPQPALGGLARKQAGVAYGYDAGVNESTNGAADGPATFDYGFRRVHEANAFDQFPLITPSKLRSEARDRGVRWSPASTLKELERFDREGAFSPILFGAVEALGPCWSMAHRTAGSRAVTNGHQRRRGVAGVGPPPPQAARTTPTGGSCGSESRVGAVGQQTGSNGCPQQPGSPPETVEDYDRPSCIDGH